ncbi:Crp/Fnr family transcriptional regulator [Agrobacterium sp. ES01]|uniref:Crp/Fnr family transcriptional regulator n=1 Tax=Agrobacterium sp. ES01 TaxID=3420714 RepID=UPI003D149577
MIIRDSWNLRQAVHSDYFNSGSKLTGAHLRQYSPGTTIFDSESDVSRIFFIDSGWVVSSKTMFNGTRTVTDFSLHGDVLSSASAALSQETVQAISSVTCFEFTGQLSGQSGGSASQLPLIMSIEMMKRHARMVERLASIGRRDAFGRTGHLLLELAVRAGNLSRPDLDGFECPLKQSEIGDALGLSTVHVNRVLKEMRISGLLSFRNGIVEFLDRRRLIELVDFDPYYLTGPETEDLQLAGH